jgi:hypothetical protein
MKKVTRILFAIYVILTLAISASVWITKEIEIGIILLPFMVLSLGFLIISCQKDIDR